MFAAASRLVPLVAKSCRQIVPPVIATLIAAGLISAYNRAFTGHLQQPRLAALHQDGAEHPSEPVGEAPCSDRGSRDLRQYRAAGASLGERGEAGEREGSGDQGRGAGTRARARPPRRVPRRANRAPSTAVSPQVNPRP